MEGDQRVLLVDDVIIPAKNQALTRPNGLTVKGQTLFRSQYGNHLGSVCLELDDGAQVISYEEFHPYGTSAYRAVKNGLEAPPKRYRYTGMERDEESGLSYHTARYYLQSLSRWTSTDPSGVTDGLCVYSYAHSNPIGNSDVNGRVSLDQAGRFSATLLPDTNMAGQASGIAPSELAPAPQPGSTEESATSKQISASREAETFRRDPFSLAGLGGLLMSGGAWAPRGTGQIVSMLHDALNEPPRNPDGSPMTFSERYLAQRGTSTQATAISLGFGRNRAAWMGSGRYSLRGVESETKQNAFAISGVLLGGLAQARAGLSELQNFTAASADFRNAMQSYSAAEARYNTVVNAATAAERPGVQLAIERMAWKNWRLSALDLRYGPSNGIDLIGEGVGEHQGLFAAIEAKPPTATASALSRLKTLEVIYGAPTRQAGTAYVGVSLQTYIYHGGANSAQAEFLLQQLQSGNVLASLQGGLFEIDFWGRVIGPH
jgi:RHS repeat-associated protein